MRTSASAAQRAHRSWSFRERKGGEWDLRLQDGLQSQQSPGQLYASDVTDCRRPFLFLDVDGPLLPFGASAQERPGGYSVFTPLSQLPTGANPLLARLDPSLGPVLMSLGCELVWATTWMQEANEILSPLLGLGHLPVVVWPELSGADEADARQGLHWKTRALVTWADGRDFIWIDDEISVVDCEWVTAEHLGRALLLRVDARVGITEEDTSRVRTWCSENSR